MRASDIATIAAHHTRPEGIPAKATKAASRRRAADPDRLLHLLCAAIVGVAGQSNRDPTFRQLAVALICSLDRGPQSTTELANRLGLPAAAVIRAIDALERQNMVRRVSDPTDLRRIQVRPTNGARGYLDMVRRVLTDADAARPRTPDRETETIA